MSLSIYVHCPLSSSVQLLTAHVRQLARHGVADIYPLSIVYRGVTAASLLVLNASKPRNPKDVSTMMERARPGRRHYAKRL